MEQDRFEHFEMDFTDSDAPLVDLPELDDFAAKDLVLSKRYPSVHPSDFYRFLFPEGSFERLGHQEDKKGNGIVISIDEVSKHAAKTIITDGLEQIENLLEDPFVICSPISYFGRSRRADHALWMYALTFDIDYVGEGHLKNMLRWFEELNLIPRPTFLVNSGHGVHLYYVFNQPISMSPGNQRALVKLKRNLIDRIWTDYTSYRAERKEALGVVQGFRMVGSRTKLEHYRLTAYKTGEKVTLDYLNSFARDGYAAVIDQPSLFSLEEAKEQWPEWYERRIVRGETPGRWHIKRDLYDWFLRRIENETQPGSRYFCIMYLAVYAAKCDIEEEELRRDAARLQKIFDERGRDTNEPFGWDECEKALSCYNESYVRYPRETIEHNSKISMPPNKRNYQRQEFHLEEARAIRDIRQKRQGRNWWDGGNRMGAPTKKQLIQDYAAANPRATQREIAQALGVSPTTVNKWLKVQ